MISKEDEYKADVCKIGGFALIAPFGKVMLSLLFVELFPFTISHLLYMVLTFLFAYIGMMLIVKGTDILRDREN